MLKKLLIASIIIFPSTGFAQQQNDPEFLRNAVQSLQLQRNGALDNQIVCEANLAKMAAQLNTANAKIKELEDKLNPPPKEEPKKK